MQIIDYNFVERSWGYFLQFTENENTTVKILEIRQGKSISYQYHKNRSEQWYVIAGKAWVVLSDDQITHSFKVVPGMTVKINKFEKHKLEALEDCTILEISKGYFDEDDIVRL